MEHVAIMRKSWGLVPKILTGKKKIESRWYKTKGETVYFKDSGEPVSVKTQVDKVIQISELNPKKVKEILNKYAKPDGLGINEIPKFFEMFKDKKYCILIFLKNPEKIKSFDIDKSGFGTMCSWISIEDVNEIRI